MHYMFISWCRALMMGEKRKKGKGGKKSKDGSDIVVKMPPSYPSTDVSLLNVFHNIATPVTRTTAPQ